MDVNEKMQEYFIQLVKELPSWNNEIYMTTDYKYGDELLSIVYDTRITECKTIYENQKGIYIKSRGGSRTIFIDDFIKPNGSKFSFEYTKERENKINELKNKYVSQKLIKIGTSCSDYRPLIYIGTILIKGNKMFCYINLDWEYEEFFQNKNMKPLKKIKNERRIGTFIFEERKIRMKNIFFNFTLEETKFIVSKVQRRDWYELDKKDINLIELDLTI